MAIKSCELKSVFELKSFFHTKICSEIIVDPSLVIIRIAVTQKMPFNEM